MYVCYDFLFFCFLYSDQDHINIENLVSVYLTFLIEKKKSYQFHLSLKNMTPRMLCRARLLLAPCQNSWKMETWDTKISSIFPNKEFALFWHWFLLCFDCVLKYYIKQWLENIVSFMQNLRHAGFLRNFFSLFIANLNYYTRQTNGVHPWFLLRFVLMESGRGGMICSSVKKLSGCEIISMEWR